MIHHSVISSFLFLFKNVTTQHKINFPYSFLKDYNILPQDNSVTKRKKIKQTRTKHTNTKKEPQSKTQTSQHPFIAYLQNEHQTRSLGMLSC